jgi:hypothetical protein
VEWLQLQLARVTREWDELRRSSTAPAAAACGDGETGDWLEPVGIGDLQGMKSLEVFTGHRPQVGRNQGPAGPANLQSQFQQAKDLMLSALLVSSCRQPGYLACRLWRCWRPVHSMAWHPSLIMLVTLTCEPAISCRASFPPTRPPRTSRVRSRSWAASGSGKLHFCRLFRALAHSRQELAWARLRSVTGGSHCTQQQSQLKHAKLLSISLASYAYPNTYWLWSK